MAIDFTALQAEVARNQSVDESAKALITRLVDEVEANKTDPAALQAIVDQFRSQNDSLAAAVAANTPADPNPNPAPTV